MSAAGYVVAVTELLGTMDSVVAALAPDLGTTAYELRLALNGGFPAVVLATTDENRARDVTGRIRARGHRAVSCRRSDVVASARMTALRDFRLEAACLVASDAGPEQLPYDDVSALLRAVHRSTTRTTKEVKERKLRPGMAIATGGLILTKTTTREVTSTSEDKDQVLYLFRRSGASPWILRERSAQYGGLLADLDRTSLANFATTTRKLRELAPRAIYDERLVVARPIRGVAEGIDAADILAHILAADLAARSSPSHE